MPRKLRLAPSKGAAAIEVSLRKFTPEDIYGKKTLEQRTATGEILSHISVTIDGSNFLTSGSTSSQYVDENGLFVPSVIPTDQDGKQLPVVDDMFKSGDVQLSQIISLEDFFTFNMSKTYMLESEEDLTPLFERCQKLLAEKKFLTFTYAYYRTAFPEMAVLIPVEKYIVVEVGIPTPLLWAKLNTNLTAVFSEEESEEEGEQEFGEFW
jgi:hypothetical protein